MESRPEVQPPLRLLSLGLSQNSLSGPRLTGEADGGGIRGISELVILEEIMYRVRRVEHLDYDPLPADYFDMICGTSTGGYEEETTFQTVITY
jgi:hypothetical protein